MPEHEYNQRKIRNHQTEMPKLQILQGEKMNLYEVKDATTGRIIIHASPAREIAKLLKCSAERIRQSYIGNYAIERKYKVDCVDTTLKKNDSIWIDWDLCRNRILKYGRK
jgi:hypothetical protein